MKPTELLGERAVRMGLATPEAVAAVLKEQRSRADSGLRVPLGSLLVELGLLTPRQLVGLLAKGPLSGFHLGEDAIRLAAQLPRLLPVEQRTIMFTSARAGDGASTVLSQTALAVGLMGHGGVLVVDANLRRPSQHERFRVRQSPGLVEALGGRGLDECIAPTGLSGLDVLPSGSATADALNELMGESCGPLFQTLRTRFAHVFVDVPAVLDHPEAALLGPLTDGVVVVAKKGRAKRSELIEITRLLGGLGVRHLGVVLAGAGRRRRARAGSEG